MGEWPRTWQTLQDITDACGVDTAWCGAPASSCCAGFASRRFECSLPRSCQAAPSPSASHPAGPLGPSVVLLNSKVCTAASQPANPCLLLPFVRLAGIKFFPLGRDYLGPGVFVLKGIPDDPSPQTLPGVPINLSLANWCAVRALDASSCRHRSQFACTPV